jgi:hypothetical protein
MGQKLFPKVLGPITTAGRESTMQLSGEMMAASVEAAILYEFEGLTAEAQIYLGHCKPSDIEHGKELIAEGRNLIPKKQRTSTKGKRVSFTEVEKAALLAVKDFSKGHFPLAWLAEFAGARVSVIESFYSSVGVTPEDWRAAQTIYEANIVPDVPDSNLLFEELCVVWMAKEIDKFDAARIRRAYFPKSEVSAIDSWLKLQKGWRFIDTNAPSFRTGIPRILRNGLAAFEESYGGDYSMSQTMEFFGVTKIVLAQIRTNNGLNATRLRAQAVIRQESRWGTLVIGDGLIALPTIARVQIFLRQRLWTLDAVKNLTRLSDELIEAALKVDIKSEVCKLRRSAHGGFYVYEDEQWLTQRLLLDYPAEIKKTDIVQLLKVSGTKLGIELKNYSDAPRPVNSLLKRDGDKTYLLVEGSPIDWADRTYIVALMRLQGIEQARSLIGGDEYFQVYTDEELQDCYVKEIPFPWLYSDEVPPSKFTHKQIAIVRVMLTRHLHKSTPQQLAAALRRNLDGFMYLIRKVEAALAKSSQSNAEANNSTQD